MSYNFREKPTTDFFKYLVDKRASEKESRCHQSAQDVLLMIDTTSGMDGYFKKALKFFTKFVKRLNVAATKTEIGMMTFGSRNYNIYLELGKLKFEKDINDKILRTRQSDKYDRYSKTDISGALGFVNKQVRSYEKHLHIAKNKCRSKCLEHLGFNLNMLQIPP